MATTYNKKYHNWLLQLKPAGNDGTYPSYPVGGGILARGTDFEPNDEITTEDWEGHTGGESLVISSDRTGANSAPQYKHKAIIGECLEEYFYMALASHDSPTAAISGASTAKKWKFYKDNTVAKELPPATLINQYAATLKDAIVYDNALMNELTIEVGSDGWSVTPSFNSDYPIGNQSNQARTVAASAFKLPNKNAKMYIAPPDVTLTDSNKSDYEYDCLLSSSLTIRNNLEAAECVNNPFGKSAVDKGDFEIEGSAEIKWNPLAAFLEDEYKYGAAHGVYVTENNLFKQVLIECQGSVIETVGSGSSAVDVPASLSIHIPYVEITGADPGTLSGNEKKTLNVSYNLRANASVSHPIEVTIVNALSSLHYGTELTIDTSDVGDTDIIGIDLPA